MVNSHGSHYITVVIGLFHHFGIDINCQLQPVKQKLLLVMLLIVLISIMLQ